MHTWSEIYKFYYKIWNKIYKVHCRFAKKKITKFTCLQKITTCKKKEKKIYAKNLEVHYLFLKNIALKFNNMYIWKIAVKFNNMNCNENYEFNCKKI